MGLLPLEFSDCLLDSPYFRENLKCHERQLEQTAAAIKQLISGIQRVLDAAAALITAKRAFAGILSNFQFDCLGTTLTDDEVIIASSLKQFAQFLTAMESEMNSILEHATEKFIQPLDKFGKEHIGSVKKSKKAFEKATQKLCSAQDRLINTNAKKEDSLLELGEVVRQEQRNLQSCSLEYVYSLHLVQERKKCEFVEGLLEFTRSWVSFYQKGNTVALEYADYLADLANRVVKTRDNFSTTVCHYEELKKKMKNNSQDPGQFNKMYTRQGYLYLHSKKNNLKLGSDWSKYYCQYQASSKTLTMIGYSQTVGRVGQGESIRVISCLCKDDAGEKFRFSVTGQDLGESGDGGGGGGGGGSAVVTYTLQALSDQDRKNWVEALGGTWPAVNTLQRIRADSVEDNLQSSAFLFLKDCLQELENRGLQDQGLYRIGGVVSKVKRLLSQAIDPQPGDAIIDLTDPKQWESKTLASAVKQYLRELSKPLMTYQLYNSFIAAVKHENEAVRLREVSLVVQKLPPANREILTVLIRHLNKVAGKCDKNLMTASNLGVCFGPTLLRPKEETVASILDIKFSNEVIEILIENAAVIFPTSSSPESSPEMEGKWARTPAQDQPDRGESEEKELGGEHGPVVNGHAHYHYPRGKHARHGSVVERPPVNGLSPVAEDGDRILTAESGQRVVLGNAGIMSQSASSVATSGGGGQGKDQQQSSFTSGFSDLSVNSLPDMSLLRHHHHHHHQATERPRSKSHQHDSPPRVLTVKSPALQLSQATAQANLLSSLELMTSLAADLPLPASPLRRSATLQPSRRAGIRLEVTRKPPLPKLSVGAYPGSHMPTTGSSPYLYSPPMSSEDPPANSPVYPQGFVSIKPVRPTNFPGELTAFDSLCLSPAARRRTSHNALLIQEKNPRNREHGLTSSPTTERQLLGGSGSADRQQLGGSNSSGIYGQLRALINKMDSPASPSQVRAAVLSAPATPASSCSQDGHDEQQQLSQLGVYGSCPRYNSPGFRLPVKWERCSSYSPSSSLERMAVDSPGMTTTPRTEAAGGQRCRSPLSGEDSASVLSFSLSDNSESSLSRYDNLPAAVIRSKRASSGSGSCSGASTCSDMTGGRDNILTSPRNPDIVPIQEGGLAHSDALHRLPPPGCTFPNGETAAPSMIGSADQELRKVEEESFADSEYLGEQGDGPNQLILGIEKIETTQEARQRDSGPYENVPGEEKTTTTNEWRQHRFSGTDLICSPTGFLSLKKMLTSGQTSNV